MGSAWKALVDSVVLEEDADFQRQAIDAAKKWGCLCFGEKSFSDQMRALSKSPLDGKQQTILEQWTQILKLCLNKKANKQLLHFVQLLREDAGALSQIQELGVVDRYSKTEEIDFCVLGETEFEVESDEKGIPPDKMRSPMGAPLTNLKLFRDVAEKFWDKANEPVLVGTGREEIWDSLQKLMDGDEEIRIADRHFLGQALFGTKDTAYKPADGPRYVLKKLINSKHINSIEIACSHPRNRGKVAAWAETKEELKKFLNTVLPKKNNRAIPVIKFYIGDWHLLDGAKEAFVLTERYSIEWGHFSEAFNDKVNQIHRNRSIKSRGQLEAIYSPRFNHMRNDILEDSLTPSRRNSSSQIYTSIDFFNDLKSAVGL